MKRLTTLLFSIIILFSCQSDVSKKGKITLREPNSFSIVIHGGAGGIKKEYFTQEQ